MSRSHAARATRSRCGSACTWAFRRSIRTTPNNFVGKPVDYAARLSDYATGGQILVSRSVVAVLEDAGMDGVSFHRHGRRELKGIGRVEIYELVYDGDGPRQDAAAAARELVAAVDGAAGDDGADGVSRCGAKRRAAAQPQAASGGRRSDDGCRAAAAGELRARAAAGQRRHGRRVQARHSQFGRVRAVKVIKQHFVDAGHDEVIRRFYQEIKAVGALEHPNIVVAIDSSAPTDSVHYLVMEYIEGIGGG